MIKEFEDGFFCHRPWEMISNSTQERVLSDTGPVLEAEESEELKGRICIKARMPW